MAKYKEMYINIKLNRYEDKRKRQYMVAENVQTSVTLSLTCAIYEKWKHFVKFMWQYACSVAEIVRILKAIIKRAALFIFLVHE